MADENVNSQAPQTQEPVDIAQAFQMVRENQQATTQAPKQEEPSAQGEAAAESGSPVQQGQSEVSPEAQGFESGTGGVEPEVPAGSPDGGGATSLGGPSASVPQSDYYALQNNLIASLQYEAQQSVLNKFRENDIQMLDVGDLYERREDGTVIFNNPDNPNRPFESREQAQAWINSMNQQIQTAFNQEVYKEQQELYRSAAPAINLIQFAPVYDSMPPAMQDIFDDLIEPYSIYNNAGAVIGFNCDLPSMARQAQAMVQKYGIGQAQQQAQQAQPKQQSGPAMDLKSGSGTSVEEKEPTNLAEAMAMLNKQKKENKNGR